eukprot:s1998_g10.t1
MAARKGIMASQLRQHGSGRSRGLRGLETLEPNQTDATHGEAIFVLLDAVDLRRSFAGQGEVALLLNGEAFLQSGVLYQAYWPESLITPPSEEAILQDLHRAKVMLLLLAVMMMMVVVDADEDDDVVLAMMLRLLPRLHNTTKDRVLVWWVKRLGFHQDFPAGDGRALPIWDAARGTLEQQGEVAPLQLDEIHRTDESSANFWKDKTGPCEGLG